MQVITTMQRHLKHSSRLSSVGVSTGLIVSALVGSYSSSHVALLPRCHVHGASFQRSILVHSFPLATSVHRNSASISSSSMTSSRAKLSSRSTSLLLDDQDQDDTGRIVRILALHGSEGTGDGIIDTLGSWKDAAAAVTTTTTNSDKGEGVDDLDQRTHPPPLVPLRFQIDAIDGPCPKGKGFSWWTMPPYTRSFNATEYPEFDESSKRVLGALSSASNGKHDQPYYDLVLGHSQGAILTTALLALDKIHPHPRLGYILNGVAWPNPYSRELNQVQVVATATTTDAEAEACSSSTSAEASPRVLMLVGDRETINPPEQAERVRDALKRAGYQVTTITHPGGHSVPTKDEETIDAILQWIADGVSSSIL